MNASGERRPDTDQLYPRCALALFTWGRWRYDVVAVGALIAASLSGLVGAADVFAGFGHPAVITVAAMLIVSHVMETSGVTRLLARAIEALSVGSGTTLAVLMITICILSAFMNNIGALALMLPVAVHLARTRGVDRARYLMPLAFASMLGGLAPPPESGPSAAQKLKQFSVRFEVSAPTVLPGRQVVQGAVWSVVIVVLPPGVERLLDVRQIEEPVLR